MRRAVGLLGSVTFVLAGCTGQPATTVAPTVPPTDSPRSTSTPGAATPTAAAANSALPATAPPTAARPGPPTPAPPTTPAGAQCGPLNPALTTPSILTIGVREPAVPPWFGGDAGISYPGEPDGTTWEVGDPYSGEGYESAVAYALADRLGFVPEAVRWAPSPSGLTTTETSAWDMYLSQLTFNTGLASAFALSTTYFRPNQALIGLISEPIADATTISELRRYRLGTLAGSAGETVISEVISPSARSQLYDDLDEARQAVEFGDVDGLVIELPTAFFLRDEQLPGGVVVGQFEADEVPDPNTSFVIALASDSPLTDCVNAALVELEADGTLESLRLTWLVARVNAPIFTP
jgi:polar amino acid transport system substrate-binding protein